MDFLKKKKKKKFFFFLVRKGEVKYGIYSILKGYFFKKRESICRRNFTLRTQPGNDKKEFKFTYCLAKTGSGVLPQCNLIKSGDIFSIRTENRPSKTGFPLGMFEWGGPKGVWGGCLLPGEKNRIFQFYCLKWPILTEMSEKYGKYFCFFCQQGGPLWCRVGGTGPPRPLLPETLQKTTGRVSG